MKITFESFTALANEKVNNYSLSEGEETIIRHMVEYFNGDKNEWLDINKGLLIRGNIGVGKSITLKLMQRLLPDGFKFSLNPCESVVDLYDISGEDGLVPFKQAKERMFDDLGTEEKGRYYGKEIEVMDKVILQRYHLFQNHGIRTHFTTNLTNDEIREKYGERSYDRLVEMCNVISWPVKESKRRIGAIKEPIIDDQRPKMRVVKDPVAPTNEERIKYLQRFFESWLTGNKHLLGHSANFDHAWDLKLLPVSKQWAKRHLTRAISELQKEYLEMKNNRHSRDIGVNLLSRLMKVDENTPMAEVPGDVKTRMEKLAIVEWFEHLKETESSPVKEWGEKQEQI